MDGRDAVVHFAAESHVDRSIIDPDAFVRTNCDGTNVMCDVARQVGVGRFLHISTDEVYGSIEEGSSLETAQQYVVAQRLQHLVAGERAPHSVARGAEEDESRTPNWTTAMAGDSAIALARRQPIAR